MKQALALKNVTKVFKNNSVTLSVLNNITYTFELGHCYGLIGASGSGKSTLLHILAGFEPATSGYVLWHDKTMHRLSHADRDYFISHNIGFVFQFHYLINELTVRENIALGCMIRGESEEAIYLRTTHILEHVGLLHKANVLPAKLSGGQQQRVALARALVGQPQFLIADEPTGNLDKGHGKQMIDLCLSYAKQAKMGLIIATHDPAVYERMQTVLEVRNGKLQTIEVR